LVVETDSDFTMTTSSLLQIKGLTSQFMLKDKSVLRAVDHIDLEIRNNEIHGLVGESGCGKSATALSVMRLIDSPGSIVGGTVLWKGNDLIKLSAGKMRKVRGKEISMVFQNPQASLNPLYTVGNQLISVLRLHRKLTRKEAFSEAVKLLQMVQIVDAEQRMDVYPHQLSGGMCQRVMIAMALSCRPSLLIADEPTAALDVTIQAQILDLLLDLRERFEMAILLISHDMGVVARMCDTVSVMYLGQIVEWADVKQLYHSPRHPYTQALLKSVPVPDPTVKQQSFMKGDIPSGLSSVKGCKFRTRCAYALEKCSEHAPKLIARDDTQTKVACWLYEGNDG